MEPLLKKLISFLPKILHRVYKTILLNWIIFRKFNFLTFAVMRLLLFSRHMGFDVLSAATTAGNQLEDANILNTMVSKLIHDQSESSFCWAFAISSMLRQSLKRFFNQDWDPRTV